MHGLRTQSPCTFYQQSTSYKCSALKDLRGEHSIMAHITGRERERGYLQFVIKDTVDQDMHAN